MEQLYAEARHYALIHADCDKFDEIESLIEKKMTDLERKQQREALEKDRGVKRAKNDKEKIEKKTKKSFKPMAFVMTRSKFDNFYEILTFFRPKVSQASGRLS